MTFIKLKIKHNLFIIGPKRPWKSKTITSKCTRPNWMQQTESIKFINVLEYRYRKQWNLPANDILGREVHIHVFCLKLPITWRGAECRLCDTKWLESSNKWEFPTNERTASLKVRTKHLIARLPFLFCFSLGLHFRLVLTLT